MSYLGPGNRVCRCLTWVQVTKYVDGCRLWKPDEEVLTVWRASLMKTGFHGQRQQVDLGQLALSLTENNDMINSILVVVVSFLTKPGHRQHES